MFLNAAVKEAFGLRRTLNSPDGVALGFVKSRVFGISVIRVRLLARQSFALLGKRLIRNSVAWTHNI